MRGVLLGMALMLAWRWAGRRVWERWRAHGSDGLPDELRRRSQ